MNPVLSRWNALGRDDAVAAVLPCCGSKRWAEQMADSRPVSSEEELVKLAEEVWRNLDQTDWLQAFATHPRIGDRNAPGHASDQSSAWSCEEQQGVHLEDGARLGSLEEGNRRYEERFGRVYLVCATGRTAAEMLAMLEARMGNDDATELCEAAEQQRQITALRLRKWLKG